MIIYCPDPAQCCTIDLQSGCADRHLLQQTGLSRYGMTLASTTAMGSSAAGEWEMAGLDTMSGGILGKGRNTAWRATPTNVDMTLPVILPRVVTIDAEPQSVTIDLARTAIVVIDMQNDFCARDGWVDHIGGNYEADRAAIAPLQKLLPQLRQAEVPVIWVNWGNRPDLLNMPPNQLHLYKNSGEGIGLGDPLPSNGARVLEKDSWAAEVVDELKPQPADVRVDKYRISGFWDTPLDSILRNLGTRTILFAGCNTDQCVLHTLTDANFLGYGCIMLADCCATSSPEFCSEAAIWNVKKCFGFVCNSDAVLKTVPQV
jgi:nicotinamidase-related amidase